MKLYRNSIPRALRRPETGLEDCLRAFGRARPVERVVLFGSYARGEERPDSDVDLCIVAEGTENQLAAARDFRRSIRDIRPKPALTLIPITPARLAEKTRAGDCFSTPFWKKASVSPRKTDSNHPADWLLFAEKVVTSPGEKTWARPSRRWPRRARRPKCYDTWTAPYFLKDLVQ